MLASKNHFQRPGISVAAGEKQSISGRVAGRPTLLAAAIAAALSGTAPVAVDAAGLGRLTVQSALGQPLRAEVEVTALGNEEIGSLNARLAPPEAFRQAGLEYNPALSGLRFAVEQRPGGGAVVRVTSAQPVNEPFVDLLVELNWSSGRFVREYTFLLDPPELRMGRDTLVAGGAGTAVAAPAARPAVTAAPVARAQPVSTSQASSPSPGTRAPAPSAPAAGTTAAEAPGTVRVRAGDTLAKIAARVKPAHVTVEQAVMAIYEANPRAFFGTVHQLFAGAQLSIPDAATMSAVDAAAARREILAQATEFNAYRARLAASAKTVQPTKAGQTAEGSVAARSDESSAPVAVGDQLKLSSSAGEAGTAAAGSSTGSADGAAATDAERQVAQDAALREQQERVAALERNVADLQRLVELKNTQLAELQRQVEAARTAGAAVSGTVGVAAPAAGTSADAGAPSASPSAPSVPATSEAAGAPTATAATAEASAPTVAAEDSVAAPVEAAAPASTETTESASAEGAAAAPDASSQASPAADPPQASPAPAVAPAAAPAPEPVASPSVLEALMDNPLTLPALVAIGLGLGAYGVYAVRRRRKGAEFEDSLNSADAFTANSLFGSTGGQAVDTHASLFATSARDSGVDVHSTEVDPIAEAEVYIAYGREAQAEEILKEALKRQPERQAIRLKLLEIHAARKDPVAFGALAQEMYDQAGGLNEEWAKVVTLGLAIDPANPLYTGQGEGSPAAQPADDEAAPLANAQDDGPPAIADLEQEADAAAAMFGESGEPGSRDPGSAPRSFGASFAETVPMEGAEGASSEADRPGDDEVPALDFDLDLETTVGRAGSELAARDADEGGAAPQDSELERAIGGRFELPSLDLDVSGQGGEATAEEPARSDEVPALADLGDFKIDLPSLEDIDARGADDDDERPAVDLADLDIGRSGLGNLELSSVDLDLSDGDVGLASADTAVAPQVESSRWQEMATKLDLASAYEEIGDKEGARELLQEVVDGGDASQQQKARAMLAKIG